MAPFSPTYFLGIVSSWFHDTVFKEGEGKGGGERDIGGFYDWIIEDDCVSPRRLIKGWQFCGRTSLAVACINVFAYRYLPPAPPTVQSALSASIMSTLVSSLMALFWVAFFLLRSKDQDFLRRMSRAYVYANIPMYLLSASWTGIMIPWLIITYTQSPTMAITVGVSLFALACISVIIVLVAAYTADDDDGDGDGDGDGDAPRLKLHDV